MITTHIEGVDPDFYCYDTGLTFGQEAASRMLEQALKDPSVFNLRNNFYKNDGEDYSDLVRKIGAKNTREIIRRQKQYRNAYPDLKPIQFKQYYVRDDWEQMVMDQTPGWLKIAPGEPDCMLQIGEGGDCLPIHAGHARKCSLFMLLQGGGQETAWYRETEPIEKIWPLYIPDMDKIQKVVSVVMEPGRWYLFNHEAWHGVTRYGDAPGGVARINIGVDFRSISAPDLLKLIKQNA
jgi:hypothetical protein